MVGSKVLCLIKMKEKSRKMCVYVVITCTIVFYSIVCCILKFFHEPKNDDVWNIWILMVINRI